ncbi:MAG: hypothetical protein IKH84_04045, partial [Ottowia sp.]|nr:hypothetical protein [Ottowia sp.]
MAGKLQALGRQVQQAQRICRVAGSGEHGTKNCIDAVGVVGLFQLPWLCPKQQQWRDQGEGSSKRKKPPVQAEHG